ncbi:MAG: tail fiber domain-containing protein [Bdellovibrionales bacterium]|nr:tail fiber domain-containing protein [Bdellovibrionales bacterium]
MSYHREVVFQRIELKPMVPEREYKMDRLLIGHPNYRLFSYLIALNLAGTLSFSTSLASEAPSGLVYQGRIMKPDNSPLEAVSVLFDIEVYSPDGACLLFEETHTINMASSGGSFALTLGTGTPIGPSYSAKEVFSNTGTFTGAGPCSYSPSTGDSRRIRVTFDEGGGPVALQDQIVQSVPYALYASKLEGKGKSDFLQINTTTSALSQANANSLFQNATYTELLALAGGTSTVFAKSVDLPVSSGVLNLSGAGQGVRVLDAPAGGDYAVNKNYSDGKIGGKSIDAANFASLADGESLKWDTTANSGLGGWVRFTPASTSGFVVNGGQAGAVSLGSTNANSVSLLTNNTTRMTVNSSGLVGIGTGGPSTIHHLLQVGSGDGSTNLTEVKTLFTNTGPSGIGIRNSSASVESFQIVNGSEGEIGMLTNHPLKISTNNAGRMTILNTGEIGIGTSTPSTALHIVGTVTVAESGTNSVSIGNGNSTSATGAIAIGRGNSAGNNTNSTAVGHSNNSSLGGVSFGRGNTTSHSTAIAFGDGNTVSGSGAAAFGIGVSNSTANSLMIGPSDAAKMTILSSGNVGIGTTTPSELLEVIGNVKATSFISTSDVRLKTNIQPIEGLPAVLRLQGLKYTWKSTGQSDAGVLAQEVEKIFPDAVRTDPVTGYKGVKYLYLIAPLIESAKELYEMCKANEMLASQQTQELAILKNENTNLKNKIENLERRFEELEKKLGINQ